MSKFKAVIKTEASKEMDKSNGGKYVLMNCEILEGPGKGLIVAGTRTTVNQNGDEKSIPEVGTEVVLHHTAMPSTTTPGEFMHFFEIASNAETASMADITAVLGIPAAQTI